MDAERLTGMLANVPAIDVPAEQRMEYNTVLEQLHRACIDLDHKLPMLFVVLKKEEVVRRLVIIVSLSCREIYCIGSNAPNCYSTACNDLFWQHSLPRYSRDAAYHAPAGAAYERELCDHSGGFGG
jgi:hypothetical protein